MLIVLQHCLQHEHTLSPLNLESGKPKEETVTKLIGDFLTISNSRVLISTSEGTEEPGALQELQDEDEKNL